MVILDLSLALIDIIDSTLPLDISPVEAIISGRLGRCLRDSLAIQLNR